MLRDLLQAEQPAILERFSHRAYAWSASGRLRAELTSHVSLFVEQLERLAALGAAAREDERCCSVIGTDAARHARALQQYGFPLAQAVNDYGDVCRVIVEVARERGAPLSEDEVALLSKGSVSALVAVAAQYQPRTALRPS